MHAWIHNHRLYGTCCCLLLFYGWPAHCPPSPPTAWTNPCSRVRELEEELRLMDQNLKSMMCGEEEVLTVRTPPRSNSDLLPSARLTCSLSTPLSVFCLTGTYPLWHQARPSSSTYRMNLGIFYIVFLVNKSHEKPKATVNWFKGICLVIRSRGHNKVRVVHIFEPYGQDMWEREIGGCDIQKDP